MRVSLGKSRVGGGEVYNFRFFAHHVPVWGVMPNIGGGDLSRLDISRLASGVRVGNRRTNVGNKFTVATSYRYG